MTKQVAILGLEPRHLSGWAAGARAEMMALPDNRIHELSGAEWVIDAGLGSVSAKRLRLRALESAGVRNVLSGSTTATVAAQLGWLDDRLNVVGCDPLLMLSQATVQTVVGAAPDNLTWLASLWPSRTFIPCGDAVGLVFAREILPIVNEAVDFLHRGVAAQEIDQGVRLGLHYPRGPMEWGELFGWPTVLAGLLALQDMYGPRFRPHPWIRAQAGDVLDNDSVLDEREDDKHA